MQQCEPQSISCQQHIDTKNDLPEQHDLEHNHVFFQPRMRPGGQENPDCYGENDIGPARKVIRFFGKVWLDCAGQPSA